MSRPEDNLTLSELHEQIDNLIQQLEQVQEPSQRKQLRKTLRKLQHQLLWQLDKMEWYVEVNGRYIKH
ncbi:MAG TPA: hypothetical protein PLG09_03910 [Syntrophomonadaceae bacterium]|jgi:hypothetical protein|nr:hypothetical protein [Syntrophomonadaceae bacterium]HOQ09250.1 hypothetical protein [Syntrophomonadaceae bacterium]HPU49050.1 hypothetical protein [Syntrophomonadaceae bacterium]